MTRVHIPIHLRWGDLDALGHVNNASMVKLLEEARLRAFWRSDDPADQAPTAVFDARVLENGGETATLIARQEIEYLRPVPYGPKPLDVQLWIGRMGGASAEICFEVHGPAGVEPDVVYARASVVVVLVETASGKPARLPQEVRETWTPYLAERIDFGRR